MFHLKGVILQYTVCGPLFSRDYRDPLLELPLSLFVMTSTNLGERQNYQGGLECGGKGKENKKFVAFPRMAAVERF